MLRVRYKRKDERKSFARDTKVKIKEKFCVRYKIKDERKIFRRDIKKAKEIVSREIQK